MDSIALIRFSKRISFRGAYLATKSIVTIGRTPRSSSQNDQWNCEWDVADWATYMVAVVQLVERQFVVLDVAGSSPVGHPNRSVEGHASAPTLLGSWLRLGRCASSSTAEQRTLNPQVLGSKPRGRTTKSCQAVATAGVCSTATA